MFPWKIVIFHSYVSLPEGIEGYNQIQRKKSCPPWLSIRGWEIPNSTEGRTKNLRITKGCWLDSCSIDLASSFPPRPDGWWSPHRFQDIPTGSWPPDISCRDSSAERLSKFQGAGMGQITAVTKGDWMLETKHEPNLWTSKSDPKAKNYNWMEHFDPVCPCSQANRRTRVHWSHFDSASPILWSDLKLGDSRQKSQPGAMVMRASWRFRNQCHAKLCFH